MLTSKHTHKVATEINHLRSVITVYRLFQKSSPPLQLSGICSVWLCSFAWKVLGGGYFFETPCSWNKVGNNVVYNVYLVVFFDNIAHNTAYCCCPTSGHVQTAITSSIVLSAPHVQFYGGQRSLVAGWREDAVTVEDVSVIDRFDVDTTSWQRETDRRRIKDDKRRRTYMTSDGQEWRQLINDVNDFST